MVEKQLKKVVEIRIIELEDKLMDIVEMANNYPDIPVPIFEQEMEYVLSKIQKLTRLE